MLGIYSIALSVFIVLATALSSGIPVTISKLTAENLVGKNNKKINSIVSSGLIISLIFSVVIILIVLMLKGLFVQVLNNVTTYYLLLSMLPAVLFTGIYAPIRGYLWGGQHYLKVSLVEFFEQIIRIGSCVVLFIYLNATNNVYAAGISLSIACVLSTIIGLVFYFTSKGKLNSPQKQIMPVLKSSSAITGVRIASSLMQPLLTFLIPLRLVASGFTQQQALSQLGIAMGMTMPILFIPSTIIGSLAMAIIPSIATLVKSNQTQTLKKQVNAAMVFSLCCAFITIPTFAAIGVPITNLLFNNSLAGEYLQHGAWLMITMGTAQLTTSILN